MSDEGAGLPVSRAALQRALAPLHRPMTHPAVGTLTLRTTGEICILLRLLTSSLTFDWFLNRCHFDAFTSHSRAVLSESVIRRYSMSSMDGQVDIHKLQIQETKPPGLQLTGTQATLTLSSEQGKLKENTISIAAAFLYFQAANAPYYDFF